MDNQTRVAAGEPVALHGRKHLRPRHSYVDERVLGLALAWRTHGPLARRRSLRRTAGLSAGRPVGNLAGGPRRDGHHVLDKLSQATLAMLTLPTLPRHRVMMAFLTTLAWIRPEEFPVGPLRTAFTRILDRIQSVAPAAISPMESYGEAFQHLSDRDVDWIIDQVHSLHLAMALHVGAADRRIVRFHPACV